MSANRLIISIVTQQQHAQIMLGVLSVLVVRVGALPITKTTDLDVWTWMNVCQPQYVLDKHSASTCQGRIAVPVPVTAPCAE